MKRQEIQEKLQEIFDDLFMEEVVISEGLSATEVDEWDSLFQINIIVEVEKAFNIRFKAGEVERTNNVGEFMTLIENKFAA